MRIDERNIDSSILLRNKIKIDVAVIAFAFMTLAGMNVCVASSQAVVVKGTPTPGVYVAVMPETQTLSVGQQIQATAALYGANATTSAVVVWTSSNPAVATVDANGIITAVSPGTATIVATNDNGTSHEIVLIVE